MHAEIAQCDSYHCNIMQCETVIHLLPSGQNLADSAGNPWGLCLLVEGIHEEILVVTEPRIHVEIQGKFLNCG